MQTSNYDYENYNIKKRIRKIQKNIDKKEERKEKVRIIGIDKRLERKKMSGEGWKIISR